MEFKQLNDTSSTNELSRIRTTCTTRTCILNLGISFAELYLVEGDEYVRLGCHEHNDGDQGGDAAVQHRGADAHKGTAHARSARTPNHVYIIHEMVNFVP